LNYLVQAINARPAVLLPAGISFFRNILYVSLSKNSLFCSPAGLFSPAPRFFGIAFGEKSYKINLKIYQNLFIIFIFLDFLSDFHEISAPRGSILFGIAFGEKSYKINLKIYQNLFIIYFLGFSIRFS
jgi:hypothetical protein